MQLLSRAALKSGLKRHYELFGELPKHLLSIRSGVSIVQAPFVQTNETNGIYRATYNVTRDKE